jgi:hypothetical protein
MKLIKEHILFAGILLLCVVLRMLPLCDYQFTYDELSGLERTQFGSFHELLQKGIMIDAHPALVQTVIFYLSRWFGYVTWIIKLPFLLCSFGAVVYAYLFGLRNFSKQAGLLGAVFFTFSLVFVFYAPIARMYIAGIFFSMALLYYFFEIFFNKRQHWQNYFWLGIFGWLSALNHHMNALFAFTLFASGFFFVERASLKSFMITIAVVVLAYLPHLSTTLYQLNVGGIGRDQGGWLERPHAAVLFEFVKILLGTGWCWVIVFILIAVNTFAAKKRGVQKKQLLLLALFIFNFLVVFLYAVFRAPIYQHSVMLFAGVALLWFLCSLLDKGNGALRAITLSALFVTLSLHSYFLKDYLHQAVKTVYEYQFERTIHYKRLYGGENVYPVFFDADEIMKKIYFEKYHTRFTCSVTKDSLMAYPSQTYHVGAGDSLVSSVRMFSEFISGLKCNYLALASAMPLHQAIVNEYFPYLVENTQTQAINFKVFSKNSSDVSRTVKGDRIILSSDPVQKGKFIYNPSGNGVTLPIAIDSLNEFPFGSLAKYRSVVQREGQVLLARAEFHSRQPLRQMEICISVNDSVSGRAAGYSAKSAKDFKQRQRSQVIYAEHFFGTSHSKIADGGRIGCYVWNRGREAATLEGFSLKLVEYWPDKWHFWD